MAVISLKALFPFILIITDLSRSLFCVCIYLGFHSFSHSLCKTSALSWPMLTKITALLEVLARAPRSNHFHPERVRSSLQAVTHLATAAGCDNEQDVCRVTARALFSS